MTYTNIEESAEMWQQRVDSLSTEMSFKVVQIQGPHKGPAKLLLLHVADLRIGEDNYAFDNDFTICLILIGW